MKYVTSKRVPNLWTSCYLYVKEREWKSQ